MPVIVAILTAVLMIAAVPAAAPPETPAGRPVITEVRGDRTYGFTLSYSDGRKDFLPTLSEALAECSEYDTFRARVRCRAEVRTWYRDLGDLKRSLAWVTV